MSVIGQSVEPLLRRYYNSKNGWIDGTSRFRALIQARLKLKYWVLDVGAGSGSVVACRGQVARVIGIDLAPVIAEHPHLDDACLGDAARLPFARNCFDLAWADWVLEHLVNPSAVAQEVFRVLKPGGCFVVRTPNLYHYVTLISRLTPHSVHGLLRRHLQGVVEEDVFPTPYRCNTRRALARCYKSAGFMVEHLEMVEAEPTYLMRWRWTFLLGVAYERLVNSTRLLQNFRANVFAAFRKPLASLASQTKPHAQRRMS